MRFSLNFIKEFLDIDADTEKLVEILTQAGMEVEHYQKAGNDWIFDIEVTTNRYDWLSLVGIAREIAACLPAGQAGVHKRFSLPSVKLVKKPLLVSPRIVIENPKDCPYYIGRVIRGSKIAASPGWLRDRVANCGLSVISNAVDITNYCMLKWGNPLHVFDLDKIEGSIYIRRAKSGEKFIGIDEKERSLTTENLVIADDKKVIALAGIMGAKNTAVSPSTRNIFLEAAIFSPISIRRSRRSVGLDTDSSYRFERMVHPDCLEYASQEAADKIVELCLGAFDGYATAGKKPSAKQQKLTIDLDHMNRYLGQEFSPVKVKSILANLGFSLIKTTGQKMTLLAPQLRLDVKREVDVYEEFSRVYGYNNIRTSIPFLVPQEKRALSTGPLGKLYRFKNDLRVLMASVGLREAVTYSLESSAELAQLGVKDCISLSNPMRSQEDVLRPTLLLSLLKACRYNLNRGNNSPRFFEIADVYAKAGRSFQEACVLAMAACGDQEEFFRLKQAVEEMFGVLFSGKIVFSVEARVNFPDALKITVDGQVYGFLGKLDSSIGASLDLKEDFYFGEFDAGLLYAGCQEKVLRRFSAYPAVYRDISALFASGKKFKDAETLIRSTAGNVNHLDVIDSYRGKDLPAGSQALTIRVFYQADDRTLTSAEVDEIHTKVRAELERAGIGLR